MVGEQRCAEMEYLSEVKNKQMFGFIKMIILPLYDTLPHFIKYDHIIPSSGTAHDGTGYCS